jgi:hypothetical protein
LNQVKNKRKIFLNVSLTLKNNPYIASFLDCFIKCYKNHTL